LIDFFTQNSPFLIGLENVKLSITFFPVGRVVSPCRMRTGKVPNKVLSKKQKRQGITQTVQVG
jgi:hypothetical protein